jgi:hypothetical protein
VNEDLWDALPSLSLGLFTRVLRWSREEVEVFLAECRQDSRRRDRHYYIDWFVERRTTSWLCSANINSLIWYAQKPDDVNNKTRGNDHVQDEELLESDEEAENISPPDVPPS